MENLTIHPASSPLQPRAPRRRVPVAAVVAVLIGAGSAAVLAWTNPSRDDFQEHAGEQLVTLTTEELCEKQSLPMVLRLWIRDCPALVASQRETLAQVADRFTTRWDLVIASVYVTRIGRQELLPGLRLPGAEVITVGVAGRFVLVSSKTFAGGQE